MIKYYKVKNNGEVAKTPAYFQEINSDFCKLVFDSNIRGVTLYEWYKKLLKLEKEHFGNLFSNGKKISLEQLKEVVNHRVDNYQYMIKEKIKNLQKYMNAKDSEYKDNYSSIEFAAFHMKQCVEDYIRYKNEKKMLEDGNIKYFKCNNNGEVHHEVLIMEDIKPIKLDEPDYDSVKHSSVYEY